jgi:hypothetical protein
MLKDLNKDQQSLARLMSDISEKSFYAGWMMGLEFDLWRIVHGSDRQYGHYFVSQTEIDELKNLSRRCGCWIRFDDEMEETAIDLESWSKLIQQSEGTVNR